MVRKKSNLSKSTSQQTPKKTRNENSLRKNTRDSGKKSKPRTQEVRIANKSFKVRMTTLRSIRVLQSTTYKCIPKLPFSRLVREIMQDVSSSRDFRVQVEALEALQEAAEMYITTLFEDSNLAATHAKRITVKPIDMKLIARIKKNEFY